MNLINKWKRRFEVLSNINTDIVAYCVRNKFTLLEGDIIIKEGLAGQRIMLLYF